jgi:serine/threonine-protein kinase RsbW
VRDAAVELRLDDDSTWELMLATTEAFANALEHGEPCDPRGIFMRVESWVGRVAVEIWDCGCCYSSNGGSAKPPGEGGRGLRLMAAIMDHVEVVPDPRATRVRFGKRLAAA